MIPYKWPVARTVPPTLRKRQEVAQAIAVLAIQHKQEGERRRDDTAAICSDFDALRRDCVLIERTFREACREAAAAIAKSRARKRARARTDMTRDYSAADAAGTELASALLKAGVDDPEHPGWPAGTPGGRGGKFRPNDGDGGEASSGSAAAADERSKPAAPHAAYADAANDNLTPEQTCLKAYADSLAFIRMLPSFDPADYLELRQQITVSLNRCLEFALGDVQCPHFLILCFFMVAES
jgi:hypothetical protein